MKKYIAAILAFVTGIFAIHKHGKNQGKKETEQRQTERVDALVEKADEKVKQHANDTVDERRERLLKRVRDQDRKQ